MGVASASSTSSSSAASASSSSHSSPSTLGGFTSSASSAGSSSAASSNSASSSATSAGKHGSHSSGGHGSGHGGHHQWHKEISEYLFTECLINVILVSLAIVFETIYHKTLHVAEHSFAFGENMAHGLGHLGHSLCSMQGLLHNPNAGKHHMKKAHKKTMGDHHHRHHHHHAHAKLWMQLSNRAGGEFMVLGFLAFVVYLFHKAGGFDELPKGHKDDEFLIPDSETAWLHMVEDVHMKLFCAMVLYFVSSSTTIHGCVHRMKTLQLVQAADFQQRKGRKPMLKRSQTFRGLQAGMWNWMVPGVSSGSKFLNCGRVYDPDWMVTEYKLLRAFFIDEIMVWKVSRPDGFGDVCEALHIEEPFKEEQVRQKLEAEFAFSTYWALIVEEALSDMIQMPTRTWLVFIFGNLMMALVFRFTKDVDWNIILIVNYSLVVMIVTVLSILVVYGRRKHIMDVQKERASFGKSEKKERGLAPRMKAMFLCPVEAYIICFWELIRFNLIYVITWTFFDWVLGFIDWSAGRVVLAVVAFTLDFFMLGHSSLVDMYLVLALPPFVSEDNLDVLIHVLRHSNQGIFECPCEDNFDCWDSMPVSKAHSEVSKAHSEGEDQTSDIPGVLSIGAPPESKGESSKVLPIGAAPEMKESSKSD